MPGSPAPSRGRAFLAPKGGLRPLDIPQVRLAEHLHIPVQRVDELIRDKRGVIPETAWLLSQALPTMPEFWINLQATYDLPKSSPTGCIKARRKAG